MEGVLLLFRLLFVLFEDKRLWSTKRVMYFSDLVGVAKSYALVLTW
jgi:hypothetical protein